MKSHVSVNSFPNSLRLSCFNTIALIESLSSPLLLYRCLSDQTVNHLNNTHSVVISSCSSSFSRAQIHLQSGFDSLQIKYLSYSYLNIFIMYLLSRKIRKMIKHKNVGLHIKFSARNLMKITWSPTILTTKYIQELPISDCRTNSN